MWSPIALPDFMGYVLVISIDWMWTRMALLALQYRCHVLFQCMKIVYGKLGAIRVVTSQLGFARSFSIRFFLMGKCCSNCHRISQLIFSDRALK